MNQYHKLYTPADSAIVFIDHQPQMLFGVANADRATLINNVTLLAKVAKEFKVFYQKVPGKEPGSYSMDHTAGMYVYDPQGRIRLFARSGEGPDALVHDLKILLAE